MHIEFNRNSYIFPNLNLCLTLVVILFETCTAKNHNIPFVRPQYYKNPVALKSLVQIEEAITSILNKIPMEQLGNCSKNLPVYLSKYNQDATYLKAKAGTEKEETVLENGLLTLKMIHRLVENLLYAVTESQCSELNATIEGLFYSANLTKPSQKDLDQALDGILTIHFTYGFNATQIRVGKFQEIDTKVQLDFDNCLNLARKAISLDAHSLAYQWILEATKLADSMEEMDHLNDGWNELIRLTNSRDVVDLESKLRGKIQLSVKGHEPFNFDDYGPCRGISGAPGFPSENMYCFYQTRFHPYMRINPVKTEVISEDPLILQFYEIFSPSVMQFLMKYSDEETWREGLIQPVVNVSTEDNKLRDCHHAQAYFETEETKAVVLKFKRTMKIITGLRMADDMYSTAIIGNKFYGSLGGYYKVHHDSMRQWNCDYSSSGDRLATMIVYLNDVKMGGYTTFPNLGVFGEPVKGSGLFSFNLDRRGYLDPRMEHTGCPVVFGEKRVIIIGIFENDNIWEFPCPVK